LKRFLEYARHPAIGIPVVLVLVVLTPECVYRSERRAELVAFMELARHARAQDGVERAFAEMRPRHLTLDKFNARRWLVKTPVEFAGHSWNLYLDFDREELTGMRIRTTDGWWHHPDEAPPDFGSPPKDEERFWRR
jgi:hypothetical protein